MKPGFLFGTSARSLRLGLFLFCLSGFIAAGTLNAAEGDNADAAPVTGVQPAADTSQLPWLVSYVEGNPNAPLQVTVYFTPFCRTCAQSYLVDHPLLQKYIDQNLVRVRYQDIYYDEPTRRTVALLHCLPREHYLENLVSLYMLRTSHRATPESVRRWADGLVRKYNIPSEFMDKCMNDGRLTMAKEQSKRYANTYMGIKTVPVYLFGSSQLRLGNKGTPDEFNALLERMTRGLKPAGDYQPGQEAPEQPAQ